MTCLQKLKAKGIETFSIFLQGQNLFTITKYESLDPETKSGYATC